MKSSSSHDAYSEDALFAKRKQAEAAFDEWANNAECLLDAREVIDYDQYYDEGVFYSGDLTEATYSLSFSVLERQDELLDKAMSDFPIWKVFDNLFKIKPRTVDMTEIKRQGYWSGADSIKTKGGEFMGDPVSFIHLSLVWLSLVNQTSAEMAGESPSRDVFRQKYVNRPFGQQVGDDLVLLRVKQKFAEILRRRTDELGLKRSKIDSISRDTAVFCEQYLWRPPKGFDFSKIAPDAVFGDLIFLDSIKGSTLAGKAKVKSDGSTPFLGHASMLAKQLAYTPKDLEWKSERCKMLLWCHNYREARGITETLAQWPRSMGGLGLAVGRTPDLDEPRMQRYLPYLYRLADGNISQGQALDTLVNLGSIWRSSSKGFAWDNANIDVMAVASQLEIISDREALSLVPDHIKSKGRSAVSGYLDQNHGIISLLLLADELNRRYNFLQWWKGELPSRQMITMSTRIAAQRHHEVWDHIRSTLEPMGRPYYIKSVNDLAVMLDQHLFGKFFKRDDPAVRIAFQGMPSLFFKF